MSIINCARFTASILELLDDLKADANIKEEDKFWCGDSDFLSEVVDSGCSNTRLKEISKKFTSELQDKCSAVVKVTQTLNSQSL